MEIKFGRVVILVEDYDKALDFYEKNFFCKKLFDSTMENGQRYLHIAFKSDDNVGIWFMKSEAAEQKNKIGKQTAGQPTIVIYTDDCKNLYNHVKKNGVKLIGEIVITEENKFFHCYDLYENNLLIVELSQ